MPEPKRYRKKAVEVAAIQWTGDNIEAVHEFMAPHKPAYMSGFKNADDLLGLPGGVASKGDWIVRVRDHFEPVDPETFAVTYEPAEPSSTPLQEDGGEATGVYRCPVHGLIEPKRHMEDWPDEDGEVCPVITDMHYEESCEEPLTASSQPASPSEEGPGDDPLANLRPASRAHLALTTAVLQCIETGVEPDTIRRFVNEELPASPSPVEGDWPNAVDLMRTDGLVEVMPLALGGLDTDLEGRPFETRRYVPATPVDGDGINEDERPLGPDGEPMAWPDEAWVVREPDGEISAFPVIDRAQPPQIPDRLEVCRYVLPASRVDGDVKRQIPETRVFAHGGERILVGSRVKREDGAPGTVKVINDPEVDADDDGRPRGINASVEVLWDDDGSAIERISTVYTGARHDVPDFECEELEIATPVVEEAPERVAVDVQVLREKLLTPQVAHKAMLASVHRRPEDGEIESVDFNKALRVAVDAALADLQESDSGGGGERG